MNSLPVLKLPQDMFKAVTILQNEMQRSDRENMHQNITAPNILGEEPG